jgi:DHA1 family bicyclomycin/chloramphenicol resistance-like MFS transporter
MQPGFLRSAITLGLLALVGPFAIDMYLPALPTIADDLQTTIAATQATLTAYFIAFGVAQLVYGPLADWIGRKPPIYIGLAIFIVGSLASAWAPSIGWLAAGRFVQAMGAATVMVVPRAIVRDLYTGSQATRMMALIMLVISVSPMLAPLAGSGLIALGGWRLIFEVLAGLAVLSILLTATQLPETLPAEKRVPVRPRVLLAGMRASCDRSEIHRPDADRRLRHGELLRLPVDGLLRLHRPVRTFLGRASASPSRSTPSASSAPRRSRRRSATATAWRAWC